METAACLEKKKTADAQPLKTKNSLSKKQRKKYLFVYLMLLPAFVNFAIFYVGINVNSFIMAFQHPIGNRIRFYEFYQNIPRIVRFDK